ncbi:hypothetical protein AMAG_04657 [Allomyces macrogynus ATCC 38327]|uniref:Uncharacterized protein n=1 Tax=Allomyces macrogynus (strain ATCC 38327) TaxID=578462 RepID=A0A0L0S5T0_ALLM3|nr:hypothetical protein AMAG_04657 [Allomyces macrogynus ATCC 38327]|eukprot:KNE57810.1 hypothetical protein AMAG_04657 [Allomyces macrogynus ATCC 38327]
MNNQNNQNTPAEKQRQPQPATKVGGVRHKTPHHRADDNSDTTDQKTNERHRDPHSPKHEDPKSRASAPPSYAATPAAQPRYTKSDVGQTYPLFQPRQKTTN